LKKRILFFKKKKKKKRREKARKKSIHKNQNPTKFLPVHMSIINKIYIHVLYQNYNHSILPIFLFITTPLLVSTFVFFFLTELRVFINFLLIGHHRIGLVYDKQTMVPGHCTVLYSFGQLFWVGIVRCQ